MKSVWTNKVVFLMDTCVNINHIKVSHELILSRLIIGKKIYYQLFN